MAILAVIYDASVLYPAPLRDLLLHVGQVGLCRPRWTQAINDEWINSLLLNRPDLSRERLERTRELMNSAVRDCLVEGYEGLIPQLVLPDPGDRHVLAAAIHARSEVIVTNNLRHFPKAVLRKHDLSAQTPDEFLCSLFTRLPRAMCEVVKTHRQSLRNPSKTVDEYLKTMVRQGLPRLTDALRPQAQFL